MSNYGYILRYYLPVKPYFDEEYTEKRFEELLSFCKETKTEAVMLYVALSPDWYYMPDTVEYSEQVMEQMLPYIKRLREAGISYQLNFQNLVGSTLGGMGFTDIFDWENLVDQRGRESLGCGCIIGEKFRSHAGKRLEIWARTEPDVIWIDDDLRLHNHGTPVLSRIEGKGGYTDYYCFCDEHIRRFNEQYGTSYDRETLVNEMTRSGEPTDIRGKYLKYQGETIAETADWIRRTVQDISPKTRLAQMTSLPDTHSAEGRNWGTFLSSLSGKYDPMIRAHFGAYQEGMPRNLAQAFRMLSQLSANVRETYDGNVEYCPEIENTRFTAWAKSRAATTFQLGLSAFMGCKYITLSIYDLEGGAFFDEPEYIDMLRDNKEVLSRLTEYGFGDMKELGVIVPTSGESAKNYRLRSGEGLETMGGATRYFDMYLLRMGIPCRYLNASELNSDGVTALDTYTASYLNDDEMKTIFSGGVLLEAGAARVLSDRGYGKYIGVSELKKQKYNINAEVIKTFTRKDGTYIRIPSRVPFGCWYTSELDERAEVLSEFLDPKGGVFPAMTYFENELGGRVAVYHAENDLGDGFYTHHRVTFFKNVIDRLCPSTPRVDCSNYLLTSVRESKDGVRYYFVSNLCTDVLRRVALDGDEVECELGVYGCAVFERKDGKLALIGKTV